MKPGLTMIGDMVMVIFIHRSRLTDCFIQSL
jgi:hypothetical protein